MTGIRMSKKIELFYSLLLFVVFSIFGSLLQYQQVLDFYLQKYLPAWVNLAFPYIIAVILLLTCVAIDFLSRQTRVPSTSQPESPVSRRWKKLVASLALILVPILWIIRSRVDLGNIMGFAAFAALLWFTLTAIFLAVKGNYPGWGWGWSFSLAVLGTGFVFSCATYLTQVTSYPFSLGWSEGNRYVNAALVADWFRDGFTGTLPVLHPTRYLLQAVPFLFTRHAIWVHRLWQALLWITVPLLLARGLTRRAGFKRGFTALWWTLLGYLFLQQGPVYYHLALGVLPVVWWYRIDRPFRTALILAVGSAWAGLSRINWYFMPFTVALLFYLLDNPATFKLNKQTWLTLGGWGLVSVLFAAGAKYGYQAISGNPAWYFDTAFSSALLWDRLLPSATFLPGILPGVLIILLPLTGWAFTPTKIRPELRWNILLAGGVLLVYFIGGTLVSVKIGGGSNLHNYDSFLVLFLLVVLLISAGLEKADDSVNGSAEQARWLRIPAAMLPVAFLIWMNPAVFTRPDARLAEELLPKLQSLIDQQPAGSQILCLSDCQLFTFGYLQADQVDTRYEKIFLMEMAMAGNDAYLNQFYQDVQSGQYSLIFSDILTKSIQDNTRAFSEENNSWVERVSRPVLAHTTPLIKNKDINLQVLAPVK